MTTIPARIDTQGWDVYGPGLVASTSPPKRTPTPPKPQAVIAAASPANASKSDDTRRRNQPWQARAFTYYDLIGEIWFAAQFYARALSRLELLVEEKAPDADGDDDEWVPATDPRVVAVWDEVQDAGGGRSTMLSAYGRLMFLAGESLLIASVPRDAPSGTPATWEVVSNLEVRRKPGSTRVVYEWRHSDDGDAEEYRAPQDGRALQPGELVAYRMWRPHPRRSHDADSPMRAVLDICDSILLEERTDRGRARSRLSGPGAFFIDERLTLPEAPAGMEDNPDADPFVAKLTEAMTAAAADEGHPAQVAPIVSRVKGPADRPLSDYFHREDFRGSDESAASQAKIENLIKRLARGLDFPQEILLGIGDANHWTAWLVDDQVWEAHVQPVAEQLIDDLTGVYLRPALAAAGVADVMRYRVGYDEARVVNHPNRSSDAKDAFDRGAMSWASLLEYLGFDEADAPTIDELRFRAELLGKTKVTTAPAEPVDGGENVATGPPPSANGDGAVAGALAVAVEQCRRTAGARLKTKLQRHPRLEMIVGDAPSSEVAARLGEAGVAALGVDASRLVAGGAQCLSTLGREGYSARAVAELARAVEEHAAATLFEESPNPLHIP